MCGTSRVSSYTPFVLWRLSACFTTEQSTVKASLFFIQSHEQMCNGDLRHKTIKSMIKPTSSTTAMHFSFRITNLFKFKYFSHLDGTLIVLRRVTPSNITGTSFYTRVKEEKKEQIFFSKETTRC